MILTFNEKIQKIQDRMDIIRKKRDRSTKIIIRCMYGLAIILCIAYILFLLIISFPRLK
jgi:hypothetical protein